MQTFLWHPLTPKCTWLSQNKSKTKISENSGKTFSVIMPPFTSRGWAYLRKLLYRHTKLWVFHHIVITIDRPWNILSSRITISMLKEIGGRALIAIYELVHLIFHSHLWVFLAVKLHKNFLEKIKFKLFVFQRRCVKYFNRIHTIVNTRGDLTQEMFQC